jgi:hypothetical protein
MSKNHDNMERATFINIAWNIITSPYNINEEQSNHDQKFQPRIILLLVHPAVFGNLERQNLDLAK